MKELLPVEPMKELLPQTVLRRQCVHVHPAGHPKAGQRCELPPIRGGTVCHKHGGKAPQVVRAAQRRLAQQTVLQRARAELERLGTPDRDPLDHLEAALEQAARLYALADLACEFLVAEGGTLTSTDRHGQVVGHPYVAERAQALNQWARISKYALDAGVAERRVEIIKEQGELMVAAARAALSGLQAKYGLTPQVVTDGLRMLGEQLRRLGPGDVEGRAHG